MKSYNKFFVLPFIIVIIVSLLFLTTQIPITKIEPRDLPVGIVNEDNGEMGANISEKLLENAPDAVKFIEYDSVKDLEKELDNREIYGGFVIPNTFSEQIATLKTDQPMKSTVDIYINEGHNTTVATTLETMLKEVANKMGTTLSAEMLKGMSEASGEIEKNFDVALEKLPSQVGEQLENIKPLLSPVQPEQVAILANPIESNIKKVNTVGKLGTVPNALFITVWISSILGAVMLYFANNKKAFGTNKEKYTFQTIQSLLPIVYGLFSGYLITLFSVWVLGYEFASFNIVALTLSIAIIAFVYMILASLVWLKLPAIAIFAILMFFGLPLIQIAPEMLPEFYQNYILPWLPMRFLTEALKEILFFGSELFNHYSVILVWISVVSFVLIWIRNIFVKTVK